MLCDVVLVADSLPPSPGWAATLHSQMRLQNTLSSSRSARPDTPSLRPTGKTSPKMVGLQYIGRVSFREEEAFAS